MSRFTWDAEADAVYYRLAEQIGRGEVVRNKLISFGNGIQHEVIIDLNEQNRIVGIEILGAMSAIGQSGLESLARDNP